MSWEIDLRSTQLSGPDHDLILSGDAYNRSGILMASVGMKLTLDLQDKLLNHKIYYLSVDTLSDVVSSLSIPANCKEEFIMFKRLYDKKQNDLSSGFSKIKNGETICLDSTYSIIKDLIDCSGYYYSVLAYIHYLSEFGNHTFSHCLNVGLLCFIFGKWLKMNSDECMTLTVSGLLHDIGKMEVPLEVLNKPGRLSEAEFEMIQNHTVYGHNMLKNLPFPFVVKTSALLHHEKLDGTGYPLSFNSDRIPRFSKIIAICDIYDAMVSKRIYKPKSCPFDVLSTLDTSFYGSLDQELVYVFKINAIRAFVGSHVKLSNGQEGEVLFIDPAFPSRPLVRLYSGNVVSLTENPKIKVTEML